MRGMIDAMTGEPSPDFEKMVQNTVDGFMRAYNQYSDQSCGFVVPSVLLKDKGISYWGVLDLKEMADEDVYIELWRRFHSALYQLGEDRVMGFGIVDIHTVINRQAHPVA